MDYKSYVGFLTADTDQIRSALRGANGVQYTESLFEETAPTGSTPLYSLKEFPTGELPSAYQIYINSVDEAEAALKLVGSQSHWRKLCSLKWFMTGRKDASFEGLLQWRRDMWERDRSAAKKVLIKLSKEGNVTAARALDKMAQEELVRLTKLLPPDIKQGVQPIEADIYDFLDKQK